MTANYVYKYLGLAVVVVSLLYVAARGLTMHANGLNRLLSVRKNSNTEKEGFTDASTISGTIKSFTSKMDDPLLVSKYRKTYEKVLIDFEDNIKAYILSSVLNNAESIAADPGKAENQQLMTAMNNAHTFRATLNATMAILNAHP